MCVFVAALTAMLAACSNATTASSATEGSDVRYDVEHVQKSLEALEAQRSQKSGATQVDADAAEHEFAAHGSSNPWQEAFDYWESCMGWGVAGTSCQRAQSPVCPI